MIDLPGMAQVWDALPEARVAGGAVRDMLAGRAVADVDFAVPLAPGEVMARLRAAGLKAVPTGLSHGTVTAVAAGRGFEVTSLRRDVETDGRRAIVAFTDDWEMDASRRDFTINAMFAARDGGICDYFGGREDLAAGRVRFVGPAQARIAEDYLRILRFFRFFAHYGRGEADAEALAAIRVLREGVASLSAERVWSELKRILAAANPRPAIALMDETKVLPLIWPGADAGRLNAMVARGAPVDALLRAAALLPADVAAFAERWRLSNAERERLEALSGKNGLRPAVGDDDVRRALAADTAETLLGRSWIAQDGGEGWEGLRVRIAAMERPVFPLQGRDVARLGVPPGPEIGQALRRVHAWWMQGGCVADAAECRTKLGEVLNAEM